MSIRARRRVARTVIRLRAAYVACAFSKARALEVIPRSTQIATAPPLSLVHFLSLSLSLSLFFFATPRRWLTSRALHASFISKGGPRYRIWKISIRNTRRNCQVANLLCPFARTRRVSARRFFSFSLRSSNTLLPVYSITETPSLSLSASLSSFLDANRQIEDRQSSRATTEDCAMPVQRHRSARRVRRRVLLPRLLY